jgi:hypothetical protein
LKALGLSEKETSKKGSIAMPRSLIAICCRVTRHGLFIAFACILALTAVDRAYAADAYVRVSLIGYESGLSAAAYLMTTSTVSGETFQIVNANGKVVGSGNVEELSGIWGNYSIYPLTFTVFSPGTYKISVSGSVSATSPKFAVDTPVNLYSAALANTFSFYQNERDGADYIPSALRNAMRSIRDTGSQMFSAQTHGEFPSLSMTVRHSHSACNIK